VVCKDTSVDMAGCIENGSTKSSTMPSASDREGPEEGTKKQADISDVNVPYSAIRCCTKSHDAMLFHRKFN
jgi:hypothetical protein